MNSKDCILHIIIPCYNEVKFISDCLNSILANRLDSNNTIISIVDGGSNDGTLEICHEYALKYKFIKLLNNHKRLQVNGLNLALKSISSEYVIRCDAHSIYPDDYFESLVEYLIQNPDVGNVGRKIKTCSDGNSLLNRAIEYIYSSKIGVGSSHRSLPINTPTEVETLLFGAWRYSIFTEVGFFDENFVRGQDAEHNVRISDKGYKIIIIPGKPVLYFTRNSLRNCLKKTFQYAAVKPLITAKFKSLKYKRSFIPALFFTLLFIIAFFSPPLLVITFLSYCTFIFQYIYREKNDLYFSFIASTITPIVHFSHAIGFYYGILNILSKKKKIDFNHTR